MLTRKSFKIFAFLSLVGVVTSPAHAKKSKVKSDPEVVWLSPLGSEDIENNAYNRCLLIKKIKPGSGKASETIQNTYEILVPYATNLYAQSIKISDEIDAEKEKDDSSTPDLSSEKVLLEEEVTQRLGLLARRMNIINAFEAGITVLDSLNAMIELLPDAYSNFRVIKNGKVEYSENCEDLK